MWLDEHDSKALLEATRISTPDGERASNAGEAAVIAEHLGGPCYVKALGPIKARAAAGGVRLAPTPASAAEAFTVVTTTLGVATARVEKAVELMGDDWYVSLGLLPGCSWQRAMLSVHGGSDIEDKGTVPFVDLDPLLGVRPWHVRLLAARAGIRTGQLEVAQLLLAACYELATLYDATLVELNPVRVSNEQVTALDARVIVDDNALYRQPGVSRCHSAVERSAGTSFLLKELGLDYVPLGGDIGILGLGAGLTMYIADQIAASGGRAAYFLDATGAAVRDWPSLFAHVHPETFTEALVRAFSQLPVARTLLVNFTSGGTPVDGLIKGVTAALERSRVDLKLVVNVDGNSREQALRVLQSCGIEPCRSLAHAVAQAVGNSVEATRL
jgi:succinyl-CoA synthetase beta subunit